MKIETAGETFNLSHDEGIHRWLMDGGYLDTLNIDGCGIIDIPKCDVEAALQEDVDCLSPETVAILKDILADSGDKDYVRYYCY